MSEEIKNFNDNFKNNIDFKIKVIIGHILTAKVFLDVYFEKYYINFIKNGEFDNTSFLKSIGYIDLMFNGDNYTYRYSLFEKMHDSIPELLTSDVEISTSLKESIIGDIINVIGRKDKKGDLVINPYDLEFLDNTDDIETVKKGINNFLENQLLDLKNIFTNIEINLTRTDFLRKVGIALKLLK